MVIVTKNQYLLASKIHHITLDESVNYVDVRNKHGKYISIKSVNYSIIIIYSPENISTNQQSIGSHEQRECRVDIRTGVDAHLVFKDIVEQIREQMTDQLYLDKALERMLGSVDLEALGKRDLLDQKGYLTAPKLDAMKGNRGKNDRSTKKVRRTRKTKRSNKSFP